MSAAGVAVAIHDNPAAATWREQRSGLKNPARSENSRFQAKQHTALRPAGLMQTTTEPNGTKRIRFFVL
jgi:hypothetical protein